MRELTISLWLLLGVVALILTGCSSAPPLRPADPESTNLTRTDPVGECARYLVGLDKLVSSSGVADAQYARIPGFPYLRTSRFLSSAARPDPGTAAFEMWVDSLRQLDHEARTLEYANLPAPVRINVDETRVDRCAERLRHNDLSQPFARAKLHQAATTPDSYCPGNRLLGLYPFTSIPFEMGVKRLHRALEATFSAPITSLPVDGTLFRYSHDAGTPKLSPDEVRTIIEHASDNQLGVPIPHGNDLDLSTRALRQCGKLM